MATNDSNFPDPNGPKPPGISDQAWYGYTTVDSTKPLAQWTSWVGEGKYDSSATGYARFKSSKVDASGNPIQGLFEHPDACPDGTTAYGKNQCLPVNSPQVQNAWNTPQPGQAGGAAGASAAPPPPPPQWDAKGNFNSTGSGTVNTAAQPGSLQDRLQQMFAQRSGSLFGSPTQGGFSGSMSVNNDGQALPNASPMNAKALSGGGLLWSQDSLNPFNAPPPSAAPAPHAASSPQPAAGPSTLSSALTAQKTGAPTTGPIQGPTSGSQYWQSQQWQPQQPAQQQQQQQQQNTQQQQQMQNPTAAQQLQQALSKRNIQTAVPNRNSQYGSANF